MCAIPLSYVPLKIVVSWDAVISITVGNKKFLKFEIEFYEGKIVIKCHIELFVFLAYKTNTKFMAI